MQDSFFLSFLTGSGPIVQGVLLVLTLASVLCWAVILAKWRRFQKALSEDARFLAFFWSGQKLEHIHKKLEHFRLSPLAQQFEATYLELQKIFQSKMSLPHATENLQRTLERSAQAQVAVLERHLHWLATIASSAPFIGLFGTVWGILKSFHEIGLSGQAHLSVVAPGISEALFATALGLLTAIPASIAYNAFSNKLRELETDMECFGKDLLNLIARSYPRS